MNRQYAGATTILLLLIISVVPAWGFPVSEEIAAHVGQVFLESQRPSSGRMRLFAETDAPDTHTLSVDTLHTLRSETDTLAYVLELSPKGYIVLSADTRIRPIIAYSFESDFPFEADDNPLLDMVVWDMENRFAAIPVSPGAMTIENEVLWDIYIESDISLATQMTSNQRWETEVTTTWHQRAPYNKFCPLVPTEDGGSTK